METDYRQTVLVTGGSRGIGRAIAVALARPGRFVCVNYHTATQAAEDTCRIIRDAGGEAGMCRFDVTDANGCREAVKKILEERGRIDILINNAGIRKDGLIALMKEENWKTVMDTNLNAFFHLSKPVVKNMIKNGFGRIVNITSVSGLAGAPGQVNYSASKAGIVGATKALAKEVASRNITVNAVAPGFIETEMLEGMEKEAIISSIPCGRLGRPEEVGAAVAFLCSAEAAYITGQVLGINGGMR